MKNDNIPTPDEYREMTKDVFEDDPEETDEQTAEDEFLERVLGPHLKAWLDRGHRFGYGMEDEFDCEEE